MAQIRPALVRALVRACLVRLGATGCKGPLNFLALVSFPLLIAVINVLTGPVKTCPPSQFTFLRN